MKFKDNCCLGVNIHLYMLIIIIVTYFNSVYTIRYRDGNLSKLLTNVATSAIAQGAQDLTGSPVIGNPSMINSFLLPSTPVINPLTNTGAQPGIVGMNTNLNNEVSRQMRLGMGTETNMMKYGMTNDITEYNANIGRSFTIGYSSFSVIGFLIIVFMLICMIMLICRRCTKDDD
ncbi:uncharacterized protein CMU_032360 [Cryptosporidium muris RN66]|uniref:Uncharacterized protein n=1 Tax=Cryptosporidium muris (strain RN66) TaxID=441375 RepID=B6AIQ3_CRYMR|nr:uncharacterized protein CMU_032360 [Cryptosporidium muris RN66]EEA08094.1 hypothetical protein, conserved [Cryptosporidium muris RN66]|eukprot:XP_002142443.1 hypothetical protein [Cryptosporidium muris RN66]